MNINIWFDRFAALPSLGTRKFLTKTHYYKDGKLLATINNGGDIELLEILKFIGDTALIDEAFMNSFTKIKEDVFDEVAFREARKDAIKQYENFWIEFKKALFEYHGIAEHPKRELFFQILRANKDTPEEIFSLAEDWADLLK